MVFVSAIIGAMDPQDDAPELTDGALDELFTKGTWRIGGQIVTREEGIAAMRKALDSTPPDPSPGPPPARTPAP